MADLPILSDVQYSNLMTNTRTTSRVIESRIEARSANLVGETKVDCEDLLFSRMCAGVNEPTASWLCPKKGSDTGK